ncbi:DNA-binding domain protein [Vibrio phage 2.117.O._10N.261.45.E9]|nr:DNA-binding domain protein [Vibrio phage 1.117.O._10N.261.45.E9]AUR95475.1 DNA-binding domain protein [Vibrio phage 1.207.B._10N.222.51.C2]AUS02366.1 DNA-binding domain protein [Vibrio phage 2.117.O._10N.261.45.E9]
MPNEPNTLLARTQELLLADKRSSYELATQCGLPYNWINDLAKGRVKNPNVNRVQYLYEQLSGKKLEV